MFNVIKAVCTAFVLAMLGIAATGSASAQEAAWRVSKISGEVSVTNAGVEYASVTTDTVLKPGDNIRTGQNGRVLLTRGEESILISPNTVIALPSRSKGAMSTTIIQRAGTILLEVEKRNVKHFEVETPYLAAVVKGTQFSVTVGKTDAQVDVMKGQVEVSAFKSGDVALVMPGQTAKVSTQGPTNMTLSGSGMMNPVRQGPQRSSAVDPITLPDQTPPAQQTTQPTQTAQVKSDGTTSLLDGAAARIDAANASASRRTSSSSSSWMPTFGSNWLAANEGLASALVFPLAIGFFVAAGVATQRRWRKRKQA